MSRRLLGGVALWLGTLEGLASWSGVAGLSWGGRWPGVLLALSALGGGWPGTGALLATAPVALAAQVGLATLRRGGLNPNLRLRPGHYADRVVERIDIMGAHGPVPALHITPAVGAVAAVSVAHGSGADKTFYAWRLVDELVGAGLAVLLIDLDGHGESPRAQAFPQIVESVAAPARWLSERYPRVGLLGMSLGGAVTARAVAEGAPCAALVLWEAPPRLRLSAGEYRRVQLTEGLRLARPTLLHLFEDATAYHIVRAWHTSGIRAQIGTWDLIEALDLLGSLRRLAAREARPPLLLVYAGRDAVLPRGSDEEVRAVTADWASFHWIRRASHISLPLEPKTISLTAHWLAARLK